MRLSTGQIIYMKILLTILLYITLFSCSRDTNNNLTNQIVQSAAGSVQYKVNGTLVVIDHVDLVRGQYTLFYKQLIPGSALTETRYMLNAQSWADNILAFSIVTDSLNLVNYHIDSTSYVSSYYRHPFGLKYNGQHAAIIFSGDFFDLYITGYQNSRISGTFTAKLTAYSNTFRQPGSTIITEGIIHNVQVIY